MAVEINHSDPGAVPGASTQAQIGQAEPAARQAAANEPDRALRENAPRSDGFRLGFGGGETGSTRV